MEQYISNAPGAIGKAVGELASPLIQLRMPVIIAIPVTVVLCIILIIVGYEYIGKLKKRTKIAKWIEHEDSAVLGLITAQTTTTTIK